MRVGSYLVGRGSRELRLAGRRWWWRVVFRDTRDSRRLAECDVCTHQLYEPMKDYSVSRRHAIIRVRLHADGQAKLEIQPLSQSGTRVNNVLVPPRQPPIDGEPWATLADGDAIRLGARFLIKCVYHACAC